jgi:hypothetical protein
MDKKLRTQKPDQDRSDQSGGRWVLRDGRTGRIIERGHQPQSKAKPEDFQPPKGGSSVRPKK